MEYFGDLDRHQREQVWGVTFDVNADPIERLDGELQQLQDQLEARLVQRLQQERDPQRRNLIYNFPSLFSAAHPLVTEFIERVFKPSRYTMTPLLRGVYFTSGTQEGTPFNRLINQLARSFSLSQASVYGGPVKGKSFFIRDLLSKVIFGESGLAGANLKAERIYRALLTAGQVALVAVPVALIGLWFWSYGNNADQMAFLDRDVVALDQQIEQVPRQSHSLISVLPVLDAARGMTFGYSEYIDGATPLSMRFGLYQGNKLARTETVPAYRNVLENAFLSRLLIRVEQQLRASLSDPGLTRGALKTYVMLHNDTELDAEYVRQWFFDDWRANFGESAYAEHRAQLESHLDALLALRPFALPYEQDRNLVEHALAVLEQTSRSERIYATVRAELLRSGDEFSLTSHGGPKAPIALKRLSGKRYTEGVPDMFSRDGYYKSFIPELVKAIAAEEDEGWIAAAIDKKPDEVDNAELREQVAALYFDEYIETWRAFLGDIRIRPFENAEDAANILQIISSDDSPLLLILQGAAERTRLELDLPTGEAVAAAVVQTVGDPSRVDRAFKSLHEFVNGRGGQPPLLDGVQEDIRELTIYMSRVARQGIDYASARDKQDIAQNADLIRLSAGNAPEPVDQWIIDIADQTNTLVAGSQKRKLNAAWRSRVNGFCQEAIAGRFPFARDSKRDVSLSEFSQFFGPGGIMDQFFDTHMADLVETGGNRWRIRQNFARAIPVNPAALEQMRLAREIQKAFFPAGSTQPRAGFTMTPERIDKDSELFSMQALGTRLHYQHDVQAPTRMAWPGAESSFGQIQLQFKPLDPNQNPEFATFSGDWAWFRLLDRSNPRPGGTPEEFRITFSLGQHFITYLLRAERTHNPFNLQLHAFQCVPNL
jgi:type VI secretion system protein ImpL